MKTPFVVLRSDLPLYALENGGFCYLWGDLETEDMISRVGSVKPGSVVTLVFMERRVQAKVLGLQVQTNALHSLILGRSEENKSVA